MKKHIKLIRAIAITIPLLLATAILVVATPILQPKYISASPEGSLTAEYYGHAAETPHDVLFVGDCEIYESFIPAVMYEQYGISSYLRGSPQQLIWQSYYLLEDALRHEIPKAVVFNVLSLKYGEPQNEAFNRMTIDGMEWSSSKVEAIQASMTEGESFASYVWTLLRFHSRWNQLTAEDFEYAFSEKPIISHSGYLLQTDINPVEGELTEGSPLLDYTLPDTAWHYLDKMRELCEAKGIELILIKSPTNTYEYWWHDQWDEQVSDYAEKNGLTYYNMIPYQDEIGLDWTTDTYDKGIHLNAYGAEKLSLWFGRILQEEHDLPDHREAEDASVWQARVDAYYAAKTQSEIISQSKVKEGK